MDNLLYDDNIENDIEFKTRLKTTNSDNIFAAPQRKDNDYIKYKFLKLWIIAIILITFVYVTYWFINYDTYPIAYYDKDRLDYLRQHTTAHPPPLFNFMDVPDIFSNKYVK